MKCGASLRQSCPGRCQHCMMEKPHSGMTTNEVKCPEGAGQSAARLVDRVTITNVVDLWSPGANPKKELATKDRPLGSGVCSVCFAVPQIHECTEQNANLTCFC